MQENHESIIHNNPVKANLEDGIEYKWSSHINYIGKKKSGIIDTSYALSIFPDNTNKAILSQKLNLLASMISKIKSRNSKGTSYVTEVIKRRKRISKYFKPDPTFPEIINTIYKIILMLYS